MIDSDWTKKLVGAFAGAAIAIPSIASGFYMTYLVVAAIGN